MCGRVVSALLLLLVALPGLALSCGCGNAQLPQDPFDPLGPWHQRVSVYNLLVNFYFIIEL